MRRKEGREEKGDGRRDGIDGEMGLMARWGGEQRNKGWTVLE